MSDLLSDLLDDYHRRRQLGESPQPDEYRDRAGESFADLLDLLFAESALDAVLAPTGESPIPRPFGGYTLLRELGRGAFGVVYEAHHRGLGRTVALKVLRTGFDTSPEAIERFKREAIACAQVRHDNIVEVYEAGEAEGRPFYAMTLLRGRSLSQLAKDGALPPHPKLCAGLAGIADALHVLHGRGIVHRDVKPGNIMVEAGGRMVLADFGLARSVAGKQLTQTGEALGTPQYMSPEQLLGGRAEINGRTDVYCLGATLYEAVAKRPVFQAEDIRELMRNILSARPAMLRQVAPTVDRDLESIAMKALEKRNSDRYPSAAAMRDDLLAYSEGRPVSGRPVSRPVRVLRKLRRHWIPIAAAAAVLLGIGILWSRRSATLEISSFPVAQVLVDGEAKGQTPFRADLSPGRHELTLKTGGFRPQTRTLELKAGQMRTLEMALIADDATDPDALARLASGFELAMANLDEFERSRGAEDDWIMPAYPRGDVRMEDLSQFRIDLGPAFETRGRLEWRVDGELVSVTDIDPPSLVFVAPVPEDVKAKLHKGSRAEWGFHPEGKGKPVVAEFHVVEPDLGPRLADLEKRLKGQPPLVVRHLRAQLYLEEGLCTAALGEARSILSEVENSRAACAIMQQALRQMKLVDTPLWVELDRRASKLPAGPK